MYVRSLLLHGITDLSRYQVHGNAGHIAQGWRPDTYRSLTSQPNTHVVTIDYRGFGYSTGWPTEAGLINDGTALVDFVLDQLKIDPERIVIMGQSLGTAVSSAVSLNFANPNHDLLPAATRELQSSRPKSITKAPIAFAGIVLVAPFYSIPSLLLTYRMGGLVPILLPLRPFPSIASQLTSQMVDQWLSGKRLAAYYDTFSNKVKSVGGNPLGMLQIIHAVNDMDISYHQTKMICAAMLQKGDAIVDSKCINGSEGAAVLDVVKANSPTLRFEILERGGKLICSQRDTTRQTLTTNRTQPRSHIQPSSSSHITGLLTPPIELQLYCIYLVFRLIMASI